MQINHRCSISARRLAIQFSPTLVSRCNHADKAAMTRLENNVGQRGITSEFVESLVTAVDWLQDVMGNRLDLKSKTESLHRHFDAFIEKALKIMVRIL